MTIKLSEEYLSLLHFLDSFKSTINTVFQTIVIDNTLYYISSFCTVVDLQSHIMCTERVFIFNAKYYKIMYRTLYSVGKRKK